MKRTTVYSLYVYSARVLVQDRADRGAWRGGKSERRVKGATLYDLTEHSDSVERTVNLFKPTTRECKVSASMGSFDRSFISMRPRRPTASKVRNYKKNGWDCRNGKKKMIGCETA